MWAAIAARVSRGELEAASDAVGRLTPPELDTGGQDAAFRAELLRRYPSLRRLLGTPLTGHTDSLASITFSPDGHTLASASFDKTIRFWDVRTHIQSGTSLKHTGYPYSVAFSPNGRTLATGSLDKTIRLWDVRTHKQLGAPLKGHSNKVHSVAFSPDGRTLASGSDDHTVRIWDIRSPSLVSAPLYGIANGIGIGSVAFSPDKRTLAFTNQKVVQLWDVQTHKVMR